MTNGGTTIWSDDAEANNGWTPTVGTYVAGEALGAGWVLDTGTSSKAQYYLVEWRNFDGFDKGLQYAYDTTYQKLGGDGAWKVEKIKYNAPGALVWYRDTSYGENNHVLNNLTSLPSEGAKGGLLIVDSHFDPLRRTGANAALDTVDAEEPAVAAAVVERGVQPRRDLPVQGVPDQGRLHRRGLQHLPRRRPRSSRSPTPRAGTPASRSAASSLFYRDADASTVVPSHGNQPYSTRVVDQNGKALHAVLRRGHRPRDAARLGQPGRRRRGLRHGRDRRPDGQAQPDRPAQDRPAAPVTGPARTEDPVRRSRRTGSSCVCGGGRRLCAVGWRAAQAAASSSSAAW